MKPGFNGASTVCNVEAAGVLKQNEWLTIVVRYDAADGSVRLLVNGNEAASASCSQPLTDRSLTNTFVGKSNWPANPTFNGDMAGVLVSDRYLSRDQVQSAASAIALGKDPVCEFDSERLHGWQVRVGNNGWVPDKNPPCVHAPSDPMTPIALNAPGAHPFRACYSVDLPRAAPTSAFTQFCTRSTCPPPPPAPLCGPRRMHMLRWCYRRAHHKSDIRWARRRRVP